jgi:hypothetical protein
VWWTVRSASLPDLGGRERGSRPPADETRDGIQSLQRRNSRHGSEVVGLELAYQPLSLAANVAWIDSLAGASYLYIACSEETRLRQIYNTALRAWSLKHSKVANGSYSGEIRPTVPKQLLKASLKAANDLYDHTVSCPSCGMAGIHLIDDD